MLIAQTVQPGGNGWTGAGADNMQTSGVLREPGTNSVDGRAGLQVTKRQVLWANVFMPVLTVLCLIILGLALFRTPWKHLWRAPFGSAEAGPLRLEVLSFLQLLFIYIFFFVTNKNWFLNRNCRCRVRFDSKRQVYCSAPVQLYELSPSDFLSARPLTCSDAVIYRFDTASGPMTVRGRFADMAAWAKWRFDSHPIQEALHLLDFPRRLRTTRETFFVSWFLCFANVYIALNFLLFPSVLGLVWGLPDPLPGPG
jgi:hypothetical protein